MNAPVFIPARSNSLVYLACCALLGLCCGLIIAAGIVAISPAPGLRCVTYLIGEAK